MVGIPALAFFDGIEMAGDGLFPLDLAFVVGLFEYTFDDSLLIAYTVGTYFVFHCWRYPAKLAIVAVQSVFFNFFDTILGHQWLDNFIALVHFIKLLVCQWGAGITILTTSAFAFAEVANKLRFYDIIANQNIINNNQSKYLCKNKG
jgi:hypothetical protein